MTSRCATVAARSPQQNQCGKKDAMKLKVRSAQRGDISLIDLIAIIAAVVIVAGVMLPMLAKSRVRPKQINCINNLKQVGLSFRLWALDNGDKVPAAVSTNEGGAKEFVSAGNTFRQFVVMSNELSAPKFVLCPRDSARTYATNFNSFRETNISYFVVPEADVENASMWLVGDRNLAVGGKPLLPGLHWLPTNNAIDWTETIHVNKGNLCVADGSVLQHSNAKLRDSAASALLAYQNTNAGQTSFRLLIP
jgi:hypothetical protein